MENSVKKTQHWALLLPHSRARKYKITVKSCVGSGILNAWHKISLLSKKAPRFIRVSPLLTIWTLAFLYWINHVFQKGGTHTAGENKCILSFFWKLNSIKIVFTLRIRVFKVKYIVIMEGHIDQHKVVSTWRVEHILS